MTSWTDEKISIVKEFWGVISASKIGNKIGVSKNAVISKAKRLKLRSLKISYMDTVARRYPLIKKQPRLMKPRLLKRTPPMIVEVAPLAEPLPSVKCFTDLENDQCRFPIKDDWCGARPITKRSYCAYHNDLAHVKPNAVKRQPGGFRLYAGARYPKR